MNTGSMLGTLIITLLVLVVLFLLLREVVCWYWKINQHVALLTEIRDLLAASRNAIVSPLGTAIAEGAAAALPAIASREAPVSPARATRDDSAIQRLAQQVRDNPRLPIDEKIELLQRLGGTFAWDKGSSCRVSYKGQERTFTGGKEFGDWLSSNVVPEVLPQAEA